MAPETLPDRYEVLLPQNLPQRPQRRRLITLLQDNDTGILSGADVKNCPPPPASPCAPRRRGERARWGQLPALGPPSEGGVFLPPVNQPEVAGHQTGRQEATPDWEETRKTAQERE